MDEDEKETLEVKPAKKATQEEEIRYIVYWNNFSIA